MAKNDTKAIDAAYLLFRARHEYYLVPNLLLALSDADISLLLRRMDFVAKQGKRPDGMDGAAYSPPLSIAFPQGRGPDMLRPPATDALPVHPSVQSLFEKPARPYESLRLKMFVGAENRIPRGHARQLILQNGRLHMGQRYEMSVGDWE